MSQAFELPAEMTIYSAMETRDALLAWIAEHAAQASQGLQISGANVMEIDGSGLQLLSALTHLEQPWYLAQPSPAIVNACATLGLGDWLAQHAALA